MNNTMNDVMLDIETAGKGHKAARIKQPWLYFGDRDVRTLVDIGRRVFGIDPKKTIKLAGTAHNALDDAKHQATYVAEIYKRLKGVGSEQAA